MPRFEGMADDPRDDEAEVEVICTRCGYHLTRSVARLRRDTPLVCPNCGREIVEPDNGGSDRRRKPRT